MSYNPRYHFSYNNELEELVEIYLDAKAGAVFYSGSQEIQSTSDTTLLILTAFLTGIPLPIPAVEAGRVITVAGIGYTITSYVYYPDTGEYVLTIAAGGVSAISAGVTPITIGLPGDTGSLEELQGLISCNINVNSDSGLLLDPICTRELTFLANITSTTSINFDTFLDAAGDDWMVRAYIDGVSVFHGFLMPDEGPIQMQDKPYEMTFHATDGLKLLGKTKLIRQDNTEFNTKHTLIELVLAALFQTGLNLPVRIYCNIFYNPMATRTANIANDMFQQAYLDYRTFMTDSTTFTDCYTTLQILFKDHFRLYYEEGRWTIYRITEAQYLPEGNRYYTDYDATGVVLGGAIDAADFGKVGKNNIVRAINENQTISASFANKSVRHSFQYNIWDEIPRNNKFERATLDTSAPNTATTKYFLISDWDFGTYSVPINRPLTATTYKAWRKSTYNIYGVELSREIQMQTGSGSPPPKILLSQVIPVNKDDKINVSWQSRAAGAGGHGPGSYFPVMVFIRAGTDTYYLVNTDISDLSKGIWALNSIAGLAAHLTTEIFSDYFDVNVDSQSIPVDGDMYIAFQPNPELSGETDLYIRNFQITYYPYVAGGYIPVKGDFWLRSQAKNYPDTYDTEVQVSDSPIGAGKGTLWYFSGGIFAKTVTDWWRFGLGGSEIRHFKELVNMGVWNLSYRRFRKIQGEFDGSKYENNNDGIVRPLSLTPRYKFEDFGDERLFLLCCPVQQDLIKGRFTGTFQEVYKDSADGTQEGDTKQFNYIFQ